MGTTTSSVMKFLNPEDFFAFLVCGVLGSVVAWLLPAGPWSVFVSMLVFYHLFIAWLLINARNKAHLALPMAMAVATHLACLVVVILYGLGWSVIPLFWLFRYAIAVLALFERNWLFAGGTKEVEATPVFAPTSAQAVDAIEEATADDQEAWLQYLAQPNRPRRKPGATVQDEYEQWLSARVKKRSSAS
ncbi:MAG: hypothetical protein ABSC48_01935 [Terracidiphilus sp.]|jgi:lysylphosphatidylglycerol synthetase-like protein (DUF2156 family)